MASKKDSVLGEQTSSVELLWGLRAQPRRGPKPALSLDRIASAAVEVADADGLSAVSMQRVASELDFTKMALYRYVAGKAELLAVMIEAAVGEPPDLDSVQGGWRPKLEEWARQMWATWDRHPWLPGATMGERIMGPNEVGWVECALAALAATGLDGSEQMDAVLLLSGHIRNTRSMTTAGTFPWTMERQFSPAITELLHKHSDHYPAVTAAVTSATASTRHDTRREFGLDRILDGLQLLITRRASAASTTPAGS